MESPPLSRTECHDLVPPTGTEETEGNIRSSPAFCGEHDESTCKAHAGAHGARVPHADSAEVVVDDGDEDLPSTPGRPVQSFDASLRLPSSQSDEEYCSAAERRQSFDASLRLPSSQSDEEYCSAAERRQVSGVGELPWSSLQLQEDGPCTEPLPAQLGLSSAELARHLSLSALRRQSEDCSERAALPRRGFSSSTLSSLERTISLTRVRVTLGEVKLKVKRQVTHRLDRAEQALREPPQIALLVKPGFEGRNLPPSVCVVAEAKVEFHRSPRELLVVRLDGNEQREETAGSPREPSGGAPIPSAAPGGRRRCGCLARRDQPTSKADIQVGYHVILWDAIAYKYPGCPDWDYSLRKGMSGIVVRFSGEGDALVNFNGMGGQGSRWEDPRLRWVLKQHFGALKVTERALRAGFQVVIQEDLACRCETLRECPVLRPGLAGIVQEVLPNGDVRVSWRSGPCWEMEDHTVVERADFWKLRVRSPAQQISELVELLRDFTEEACSSEDGQWMWPLSTRALCEAVLAREALVGNAWENEEKPPPSSIGRSRRRTCLRRLVNWLCIQPPQYNGALLRIMTDHFGHGAAFSIAWAGFYAQQLWLLALISCFFMLFGTYPVGGHYSDIERIKFEALKLVVVLWGICMSCQAGRRFAVGPTEPNYEGVTLRPSYNIDVGVGSFLRRWAKMLFWALPALFLFYVVVITILVLHTQLILHVIYTWGDCLSLHRKDAPCRDPQVKHGFWLGVLAEVGLDVSLAIIFELIVLAGQAMAQWIAAMREYKYASDQKFFVNMLTVALAVIDRIGFVSVLAFLYVPQWMEPKSDMSPVTAELCKDLGGLWQIFGDSSYWCLQKRLPVQSRRWVLSKLMKGPFLVAPFVQLGMTVIVPKVVEMLDRACVRRLCEPRFCWPCRCLVRFWSLVFSYEAESTGGCCPYMLGGDPFTNWRVVTPRTSAQEPEDSPDCESRISLTRDEQVRVLDDATRRAMRKPFEPYDELLNEKMNLLWVIFCTPIFPVGVFATLLARVVRLKFIVEKLLYVRRRQFPESDAVMRRMMLVYVRVCCFASVGWSIGLSCITYNDDLWKYETKDVVLLSVGIVLWLASALWLLFFWPIS